MDQPVQLFYSADPLGRTSFCGQTETACQCARPGALSALYCDDGTTLFISAIGAMILDNTLLKWHPETFYKKAETEIKIQGMNLIHRFIK